MCGKNVRKFLPKRFKNSIFMEKIMSLWSDVYFLKSNAGVHDIWDCLRNVFPDFRDEICKIDKIMTVLVE